MFPSAQPLSCLGTATRQSGGSAQQSGAPLSFDQFPCPSTRPSFQSIPLITPSSSNQWRCLLREHSAVPMKWCHPQQGVSSIAESDRSVSESGLGWLIIGGCTGSTRVSSKWSPGCVIGNDMRRVNPSSQLISSILTPRPITYLCIFPSIIWSACGCSETIRPSFACLHWWQRSTRQALRTLWCRASASVVMGQMIWITVLSHMAEGGW